MSSSRLYSQRNVGNDCDMIGIPGPVIETQIQFPKSALHIPTDPPYKWDRQKLAPLITTIYDAKSLNSVIIPDLGKGLTTEILRFKIILEWYEKNIPDKYMGTKELFLRTLEEGPAFTAELSNIWKLSQRKTFQLEWDRLLTEDAPTLIGGLDYIFDPKCLPRWELPDEEDYKYMLIKNKPIPSEKLERLYDMIVSMIPSDIKIPKRDILDDLEYFRASKVVASTSNWKTEVNYKSHSSKEAMSYTTRFRFKRALIWKTADEVRDALICDKPTLHTLCEVGRILGYIGRHNPEYKIGERDIHSDLNRIKGKNLTYLMVDLKKCGLTFPRELVITALKAIYNVIPSPAIECAIEGYTSNPILHVGEEDLDMTNGLGLGMLNELVTIIMVAIFRIAKEDNIFKGDCIGWFLGDDQLIYWDRPDEDEGDPKEIRESWETYLSDYGFLVHGKKPFTGKVGQFCEQFTRTKLNTEKRTRQFSTLLSFLDAHNIMHAKELFAPMYKHWWGLSQEDNDYALDLAISYWGIEFTKEERYLPIEYGGWIRFQEKYSKLNPALVMYDEGKIPTKHARVWFNIKIKPLTAFLKTSKKIKGSCLSSLLEVKEEYNSIYSLKEHIENLLLRATWWSQKASIAKKFKQQIAKYYASALTQRQKAFKEQKEINFLKFLQSREFNNYCIPLAIIKENESKYLPDITYPDFEITRTDDIRRLWLRTFTDAQVRGPLKGDATSLIQEYISIDGLAKLKKHTMLGKAFFQNWDKLSRFGTNTVGLLQDLDSRTDIWRADLSLIPKSDLVKNLLSRSVIVRNGDNPSILPIEGNIYYIDISNISYWMPIDTQQGFHRETMKFIVDSIMSLHQIKKDDEEYIITGLLDAVTDFKSETLCKETDLWLTVETKKIPKVAREPLEDKNPPETEERIRELNEYLRLQVQAVSQRLNLLLGPEERKILPSGVYESSGGSLDESNGYEDLDGGLCIFGDEG